jgi:hypothetical protein
MHDLLHHEAVAREPHHLVTPYGRFTMSMPLRAVPAPAVRRAERATHGTLTFFALKVCHLTAPWGGRTELNRRLQSHNLSCSHYTTLTTDDYKQQGRVDPAPAADREIPIHHLAAPRLATPATRTARRQFGSGEDLSLRSLPHLTDPSRAPCRTARRTAGATSPAARTSHSAFACGR